MPEENMAAMGCFSVMQKTHVTFDQSKWQNSFFHSGTYLSIYLMTFQLINHLDGIDPASAQNIFSALWLVGYTIWYFHVLINVIAFNWLMGEDVTSYTWLQK